MLHPPLPAGDRTSRFQTSRFHNTCSFRRKTAGVARLAPTAGLPGTSITAISFELENSVNTRKTVLTAVLCLTAVVVAFAADPNVGTWKLNEAKSQFAAGAVKNLTVTYTSVGENYKCVVYGIDAAGKPTHNEWTGKFDGKDYPVIGDPSASTRSLRMVKPGHYALTNKKDGKTIVTGTVEFSADNKSRTLTIDTTDAAGNKQKSIAVYDRQ
jgi:hypothetical protein